MNYAVIMAGGRGERFWPLSRREKPKQFLQLVSKDPLVLETIKRLEKIIDKERIYVVTTDSLKKRFIDIGIPEEKLILEPFGMNTLYAITLSAIVIYLMDSEGSMITVPSDHFVGDVKKFANVIDKGLSAVNDDTLVTFGIKPTRPETGYGYIEIGEKLEDNIYNVKRFTEKPNLKKAAEFIKSGTFFWNSGIFLWKVKKIINEVKMYHPHLVKAIDNLIKNFNKENIMAFYSIGQPISIDYGVMERSKNVAMIVADFSWDDIGTWTSLERIFDKDARGNVAKGDVLNINNNNCILFSQDGVILAEGLNDYIIVHTEDATLVLPKARAQDLRRFLKEVMEKYL